MVIIEENENQVVSTSVLQGNRLHLSGKKKKKKRERESDYGAWQPSYG